MKRTERTPREKRIENNARVSEQQRCIRILRRFFEWKDPDDRARGNEIVQAIRARPTPKRSTSGQ